MNLSLLHPFHQARLISNITFQHFSVYRWEWFLDDKSSLCGLSQSTKDCHASHFKPHSPTQALFCPSALFKASFLGFSYSIILLSLSFLPFLKSLDVHLTPVLPAAPILLYLLCSCAAHTIPVVASLPLSPPTHSHTHRHWQVVPCLFISTSRWLDLL